MQYKKNNILLLFSLGSIFFFSPIQAAWKEVATPGTLFKQVSVGSKDFIVGLTQEGQALFHSPEGLIVQSIPYYLSVGIDGTLWGIRKITIPGGRKPVYTYPVCQLDRTTNKWIVLRDEAIDLSVGNAQNVWIINRKGNVLRWNGTGWDTIWKTSQFNKIAVGTDGTVWGVHFKNMHVFGEWNPSTQNWTFKSSWERDESLGKFKQISVGDKNNIWVINTDGKLFKWGGTAWAPIPSKTPLIQISAGTDGNLWGIMQHTEKDATGKITKQWTEMGQWNTQTNNWKGLEIPAKYIAIRNKEQNWTISPTDMISKKMTGGIPWSPLPGANKLKQIAAANDRTLFGIAENNIAFQWDWKSWSWKKVKEGIQKVAVQKDNSFCLVSIDGDGYAPQTTTIRVWKAKSDYETCEDPRDRYTTSRSASSLFFKTPLLTQITDLSLGSDDSLWFILKNNTIISGKFYPYQASTKTIIKEKKFFPAPEPYTDSYHCTFETTSLSKYKFTKATKTPQLAEPLIQISVGNKDHVWAVSQAGNIFKVINAEWVQITGNLKQISASSDGTVMGVDATGKLLQYTPDAP